MSKWILTCAVLFGLSACGDPAPGPKVKDVVPPSGTEQAPEPHAQAEGSEPLPEPLPEPRNPTSAMQKATYALQRLTQGPGKTHGLRITHLHRTNLDLARRDLVALPVETLTLLSDEALHTRVTTAHPNNQDPWHNILSVLAAIKTKPAALVAKWTLPALSDRVFPTLRREAVRVLTSERQEENAALTMRFLEAAAHDRETGQFALRALGFYGSPWRARATAHMLTAGTPSLWTRVVDSMEGGTDPVLRSGDFASAMLWWAAIVEGSGPRLSARLPRVKRVPWVSRRVARPFAPYPLPSDGTIGLPLVSAGVFPLSAFSLNGESPAGDARCALARLEFPAFVASVKADRLRPEHDPLYKKALHCMLPGEEQDAQISVQEKLADALVEAIADPDHVDPIAMGRLIDGMPDPSTVPESRALLIRVLLEFPSVPAARPVTERVSDRLTVLDEAWVDLLNKMLASEDPASAGRALRLMFRSADVRFLDAIEAHKLTLDPSEAKGVYLRLVYIYASGNVEPARKLRFVRNLELRLQTASEADVQGLASALLDFGESGAEAFARGLRGPRRRLFLSAWPANSRAADLGVARAAVEPLGPKSDPSEIAYVMNLAYLSFPESAVPALELLADRLPARQKAWVEVVLERVRHRAFH